MGCHQKGRPFIICSDQKETKFMRQPGTYDHNTLKGKRMKERIFGVLQRIGRSFMLPIAILPAADCFWGLGSSFTNSTMIQTYGLENILGSGTVLHEFLTVLMKAGNAVFNNLPLIFAIGVAIGMAKKEKEVAALAAAISYFVMNASINAMLEMSGQITADGIIASGVLNGTITSVVGIQTLQTGVFGGIIVGLGVAVLHNRFCMIELPAALSFFSGSRFIPIIQHGGLRVCGNSFILYMALCPAGNLCSWSAGNGDRIFSELLFSESLKRALLPFGLHHGFLSAVLADRRRRFHGSGRQSHRRRTEYLFRPAGRSKYGSFQCGCVQIFFR